MSEASNGSGEGSRQTAREIAERYEVTAATVQRWSRNGDIPFYMTPGGQYRYDPVAVDESLKTIAARKGQK